MASHFFEAITRYLTHDEVVTAHGIQRIDQFPSSYAVACIASSIRTGCNDVLIGFQVLWTTWTCKEQWHLEQRSTFLHERQIETQEIMVFDDIGIAFTDERTEVGDELCLPIGRRGLKDGRETPVIANSYKKDAATFGV